MLAGCGCYDEFRTALQRACAVAQIDRITLATMASRGVQYQLDSMQYQPLTTCNTSENRMVPYVDSCKEIIHHMIIVQSNKERNQLAYFFNTTSVSLSATMMYNSLWLLSKNCIIVLEQ